MKPTVMFVELMLHCRLGLIFCSKRQRAPKRCLKQASLWHHKNALLSLLQKQNLLFIQPPAAPSQGCCALFFETVWPRAPVTTAEWLNLSAVAGCVAPKREFCCHFHAHLPFPSWLSESDLGSGPVSGFPRKQHMLFDQVFVLLLRTSEYTCMKCSWEKIASFCQFSFAHHLFCELLLFFFLNRGPSTSVSSFRLFFCSGHFQVWNKFFVFFLNSFQSHTNKQPQGLFPESSFAKVFFLILLSGRAPGALEATGNFIKRRATSCRQFWEKLGCFFEQDGQEAIRQGEYNPPCGLTVRLHEVAGSMETCAGLCLLNERCIQVKSDQTVAGVLLLLKEYFRPLSESGSAVLSEGRGDGWQQPECSVSFCVRATSRCWSKYCACPCHL